MANTAAAATAANPSTAQPAAAPARKGRGKSIVLLAGMLLLGAVGGGGWMYFQKAKSAAAGGKDAAHAAQPKSDPIYVSLEQPLVVNLEDVETMRFMQIEAQVAVHDEKAAAAVKLYLPLIRNRLLLLFSGQHYATLNTREAKEKLQQQALDEVQKLLQEQTGKPTVDALYFTSMVMQ